MINVTSVSKLLVSFGRGPRLTINCTESTVWKNAKFTLTQKKIREIDFLITSLGKLLLSRNFFQKYVRVNFRIFHTVESTLFEAVAPRDRQ